MVRIAAEGREAAGGFNTALIYASKSLVEIVVTFRLLPAGGF